MSFGFQDHQNLGGKLKLVYLRKKYMKVFKKENKIRVSLLKGVPRVYKTSSLESWNLAAILVRIL